MELTCNGEKYLAFYTHFPASGDEPWNDPEPIYSTTYRLLGMKDGELTEVHQIDSRGNGGTADGALISQGEFDAIANSARCVAWFGCAESEANSMLMGSEDIALNPQAFIELYSH